VCEFFLCNCDNEKRPKRLIYVPLPAAAVAAAAAAPTVPSQLLLTLSPYLGYHHVNYARARVNNDIETSNEGVGDVWCTGV